MSGQAGPRLLTRGVGVSGCGTVPRMVRAGRSTATIDALALHRRAMPELKRGGISMARIAQVARVAVLVAATQRQWLDVVDDGGEHGEAALAAPFAQPVRAIEAALALTLASSAAQPLGHAVGLPRTAARAAAAMRSTSAMRRSLS